MPGALARSQTAPCLSTNLPEPPPPPKVVAVAPGRAPPQQHRSAPLQRQISHRVWRPGPRKPPPLSFDAILRKQFHNSMDGLSRENNGETRRTEFPSRDKWFEELALDREVEEVLRERKMRQARRDEIDTLSARLDALAVMRNGDAFLNAIDKRTLLGLLSGMRKAHDLKAKSPLTDPYIAPLKAKYSPDLYGRKLPANELGSSGRDHNLNKLVENTLSFAHKRRERRKPPPKPPNPFAKFGPNPAPPTNPLLQAAKLQAVKEETETAPAAAKTPEKAAEEPPPQQHPAALGGTILGLRWSKLGSELPPNRVELQHAALSKALGQKVTFTRGEWKALDVRDLRPEHVVRVGHFYFEPAAAAAARRPPPLPAHMRTEEARRERKAATRLGRHFSLGLFQRLLEEQRVAKAKEEDDARAIREQKREDMTQSRRDHLAKNDGDDDPASVERKKKHDAEQDQYDSLLALMQSPLKSGWSVSSL